MAMFGLATSSALRREVSTLNIKALIRMTFDKAKSDLEETILDVDDEDHDLPAEAGEKLFASFRTPTALKIITYVSGRQYLYFSMSTANGLTLGYFVGTSHTPEERCCGYLCSIYRI